MFISGPDSTVSPTPAGKAMSKVMRNTDSTVLLSWRRFLETHAAVITGSALIPKVCVKLGTRLT